MPGRIRLGCPSVSVLKKGIDQSHDMKNWFRQFLTRFTTSDWFLAMLKISTEHGSKFPVEVVSEAENNIEQNQVKSCCLCYSS